LRLVGAQGNPVDKGAKSDDIEKAIARLDSERERLEARLTTLARENKRLKTDLSAFEATNAANGNDASHASAALREQMNELAAEVVNLTAKLEGPDSPIAKALATPQDVRPSSGERSLADRVRALQKAESPS
jgi:chromosome segregation ATPase